MAFAASWCAHLASRDRPRRSLVGSTAAVLAPAFLRASVAAPGLGGERYRNWSGPRTLSQLQPRGTSWPFSCSAHATAMPSNGKRSRRSVVWALRATPLLSAWVMLSCRLFHFTVWFWSQTLSRVVKVQGHWRSEAGL